MKVGAATGCRPVTNRVVGSGACIYCRCGPLDGDGTLRVALLTAIEPARAGDPASPSLLRVGGALVARHQLALALGAGCRRIICLSRGFAPPFGELQHDAQQGGASFHLITGPQGLVGLVSAADEILAFAEGLLPTPGDALPLLQGGQSVLVLPADPAVGAGFERIDLTQAWAGLMLVPGRLIDRLMDMAPDIDPVSALLRIALQAGVPRLEVPDAARGAERWLLVRSEAEAQVAEERWMERHMADGPRAPGPWLARFIVRHFGAAMLHEGVSAPIGYGLAVILGLLGLATAWSGWLASGLALAAVARIVLDTITLLLRLRREALGQASPLKWRSAVKDALFDLMLVILMTLASPALPGQSWVERGFASATLIGLLWLVPQTIRAGKSGWLEDRLSFTLVLMLLAAGQVLGPGVMGMALALLGYGLYGSRGQPPSSASITRA